MIDTTLIDRIPAMTTDQHVSDYPNTVIHFFADGSLVVDLTKPLPEDLVARMEERALGPTFAVITACNPRGHRLDDRWNRNLTRALREDVERLGVVWEPATGVSLDGTHQEEGVVLSIAKEDARQLARKFAQTAFFWFDGDAVCVVPSD